MSLAHYTHPRAALATIPIALTCGATAAVLAGRAYTAGGYSSRTAAYATAVLIATTAVLLAVRGILRHATDARNPVQPPHPDPHGLWTTYLDDVAATVSRLTDDTLARLQARADATRTTTAATAEREAWLLAEWYGRVTTGSPTPHPGWTLGDIAEESTGAYLAALAALVRDRLTITHYTALTQAWVDEGLPLPGGPAAEHLTFAVEVPTGIGGQWTVMQAATISNGDGDDNKASAASAAQHAQALAVDAINSGAVDALPVWRLRVWNGLDAGLDAPADGVYTHGTPALALTGASA